MLRFCLCTEYQPDKSVCGDNCCKGEGDTDLEEVAVFDVITLSAEDADTSVLYLSDDRLNGLAFGERMGGTRLRSIDEENMRLLEGSASAMTPQMGEQEDPTEGLPYDEEDDSPESEETDSTTTDEAEAPQE